MAKSVNPTHILLLFSFIFAAFDLAAATDHIVGGHLGWNPNINYSLWSNNQTFYAGDLVSFRYQKNGQYNVFEVNKTGYDNCTMDGLAGNWSSGKDFIPLDEAKTYYFICGNGLCFSGMKVAVKVVPLPSSPDRASNSSHGASAACVVRPVGLVWLLIGVFAAAAGWI